MGRISTYICGSAGPNDQFNPFKVTRQDYGPEILFLLNSEPLGLRDLSTRLNMDAELAERLLGDLARIGAVEERNGKWSVSFAIFNKQDIRLIAKKTKRYALDLADEIAKKRREIEEILARLSCARQVEMGKLAFAVVGCFMLDWKGLETLNQKGLTLCGKKKQPGDRNYVLLGREEGAMEGLLERVYWGSHSSNFGSITFTSFGDHAGCRFAFPDLTGYFPSLTPQRGEKTGLPDWLSAKTSEALGIFQVNSIVDCGRLLLLLESEGPWTLSQLSNKLAKKHEQVEGLLRLLTDAKYVSLDGEQIKLNYPVFTARDKGTIEAVWEVMSETVQQEALDCFESLGTELAEITPMKRGIDPREIYTDVWHWVFGQANRIMAERGFMFEPTGGREGEGRYIAWVDEGRNRAPGSSSLGLD
jgi:hypothetical protein